MTVYIERPKELCVRESNETWMSRWKCDYRSVEEGFDALVCAERLMIRPNFKVTDGLRSGITKKVLTVTNGRLSWQLRRRR